MTEVFGCDCGATLVTGSDFNSEESIFCFNCNKLMFRKTIWTAPSGEDYYIVTASC